MREARKKGKPGLGVREPNSIAEALPSGPGRTPPHSVSQHKT